jgi:uncharacterized protein (DUF427 family)
MTLSIGTGPLAGSPAGDFNFSLDEAPKHRIWFADYAPRLRAVLGDGPVFDTTRGKLLYETGILPVPYVPLEDFDHARMTRTDRVTYCPFKGDASYWSVGEAQSVVWAYEDPKPEAAWLRGYAAVYWDRMDGWFIEEERVFAHLRDPYHRVDVHESSRPVEVRANGAVIARSERPKLLFETGLRPRVYVPRADIAAGVLSQAEKRTQCPYKGEATYWSLPGIPDAAWSYEAPLPEAVKIQGHVSFDAGGVEVALGPPRASVPPAPRTAR